MAPVYRTLRVAPAGEGVLGVVIDAPPMNLIGPELVRDLVTLFGVLASGQQETRVVVLESADPDYFVRSAKRALNELTLPAADAVRGDARRFHQLVPGWDPSDFFRSRWVRLHQLPGGDREPARRSA